MQKSMYVFFLSVLLVACVTEEGAHEHYAKNKASSLKWLATVHTDTNKSHELGMFMTREDCENAAMKRIKKDKYRNVSYSCSI